MIVLNMCLLIERFAQSETVPPCHCSFTYTEAAAVTIAFFSNVNVNESIADNIYCTTVNMLSFHDENRSTGPTCHCVSHSLRLRPS